MSCLLTASASASLHTIATDARNKGGDESSGNCGCHWDRSRGRHTETQAETETETETEAVFESALRNGARPARKTDAVFKYQQRASDPMRPRPLKSGAKFKLPNRRRRRALIKSRAARQPEAARAAGSGPAVRAGAAAVPTIARPALSPRAARSPLSVRSLTAAAESESESESASASETESDGRSCDPAPDASDAHELAETRN